MLLFYFAAREDAFGARVERAAPSMNWMSIIEFLGGASFSAILRIPEKP